MRTVGLIEKPTTEKKEAPAPKVEASKTVEKVEKKEAPSKAKQPKKDGFNI